MKILKSICIMFVMELWISGLCALQQDNGLIIACMGLPGSGKTTCAIELSRKIKNAKVFLEPEEKHWYSQFEDASVIDSFDFITSLRSIRVSNLRNAQKCVNEGMIAIVDSYYDKLFNYYIDSPEIEWLFPKSHEYFSVMKQITELDKRNLPTADFLLFFQIDEELWKKFLKKKRTQ